MKDNEFIMQDDTLLINDLQYYTERSRLRSARRKKRAQHTDFDKKLLSLHREEKSIYSQLRVPNWKELKPPIQNGWKRSFVLREEIKRSKQALFFQKILDKINTTEYSWRKDFKKKKKQRGKKVYITRDQSLRELEAREFFSKKFTDEERFYFYETMKHPRWSKRPETFYVFCEPWRFTLKIQSRMITHVRIQDADLKSKSQEIDSYIKRNNLRPKINKLLHGCAKRWIPEKIKYRNPLKNIPLYITLNEHWPLPESNIKQLPNPRITPGGFFCNLFLVVTFFLLPVFYLCIVYIALCLPL